LDPEIATIHASFCKNQAQLQSQASNELFKKFAGLFRFEHTFSYQKSDMCRVASIPKNPI
jgi:hypothetical protein